MSRWKGARNSYSNGSCRVTWTFSALRPPHAMDWRLTMSAGRRLGAWKEDSRGAGKGARGAGKKITRVEVALSAAGFQNPTLGGLPSASFSLGFFLDKGGGQGALYPPPGGIR